MIEESNPDIAEKEMTPLERMRHSGAHVLAEAVLEKFPDAKLGIGPPIENGFYYDFDLPRPLTPEDLAELKEGMRRSIETDKRFERRPISLEEARSLFSDQPYSWS